MRKFAVGWVGLVLLALSGPSRADILCLKDGRIYQDVNLVRDGDGVLVKFENGEVRVPSEQVLEAILLNDTSYEPETDEEREKLAAGKVKFDGRWVSHSRRDKLLSARLEEETERIEEMRRTSEWRNRIQEETKNFAFEVTMPRNVFEHFKDLVEVYFAEFGKTFKIKRPRGLDRLPLLWYNDYDQFVQVTGMNGALGFFTFVEPMNINLFYDRLDLLLTEQVMYHEVGHYLQKLFDVEVKYPHWPGEALCEYYGASTYDPKTKKMTTGLIQEGRLTEIKYDISRGKWIGVKEMILGCQDRNYEDYTWGWSFVHYMMNHPKYSKKFPKFVTAVSKAKDIKRVRMQITPKVALKTVEGEEMLRAFMKYMGIKKESELEEIEKGWHEYVDKELVVSSSQGLAEAAVSNLRRGRPKKALRLFGEAVEAGSCRAIDLHRYAKLLATEGEAEKAIELWREAMTMDPLTAEYYVSCGAQLLRRESSKDREEGRRLLLLSREINSDDSSLDRRVTRLLDED